MMLRAVCLRHAARATQQSSRSTTVTVVTKSAVIRKSCDQIHPISTTSCSCGILTNKDVASEDSTRTRSENYARKYRKKLHQRKQEKDEQLDLEKILEDSSKSDIFGNLTLTGNDFVEKESVDKPQNKITDKGRRRGKYMNKIHTRDLEENKEDDSGKIQQSFIRSNGLGDRDSTDQVLVERKNSPASQLSPTQEKRADLKYNMKNESVGNDLHSDMTYVSEVHNADDMDDELGGSGHFHGDKTSEEKLDDWKETFGTLSSNLSAGDLDDGHYEDDEGEVDEWEKPYLRLSEYGRKHEPRWYGKQMEKLIDEGKLKDAIHMYEVTMLEEDRVRPTAFVYNVLIGGLGRAGYTHKAFKLFRKMRQFGIEPEDPVFTGLFNACANSPWREDGLKRADGLFDWIRDKNYMLNSISYNAAVKAYGKLGELQNAFRLIDEMVQAKITVDESSFAHLLIACVSDKEAGYKHAIEVWRKMRKKKIMPRLHHYNLLIRVIRECGVGNLEYAQQLLPVREKNKQEQKRITPKSSEVIPESDSDLNKEGKVSGAQQNSDSFIQLKPLSVSEIEDEDIDPEQNSQQDHVTEQHSAVLPSMGGLSIQDLEHFPNLLNPRVRTQGAVSLGKIETAQDRLALLGGLPGLLSHMARDKVVPNIKTFSMLVSIIPPTIQAEDELLAAMKSLDVTKDTGFYNQIINNRIVRKDNRGARALAVQMAEEQLIPDRYTFGCLAKSCKTRRSAMQLLDEMQAVGLKPDVMVCGTLMYSSHLDFHYKLELLWQMKKLNITPNQLFLSYAEHSIRKANDYIVKLEKGENVPRFVKLEGFRPGFRNFMLHYKQWLLDMKLHQEEHPWAEYRSAEQQKTTAD